MSRLKTQLVLKTADIPNVDANRVPLPKYTNNFPTRRTLDYDNISYTINKYQSNFKFKNINMRMLLRDIFAEGEEYIIELTSLTFGLAYDGGGFGSTSENDRVFNIYIKGLPFLVSSSSASAQIDKALLATVRVPSGATINNFIYNSNKLSFKLNQAIMNQYIDLEFAYRDIESDSILPNAATVYYPNVQFVFSVYKAKHK